MTRERELAEAVQAMNGIDPTVFARKAFWVAYNKAQDLAAAILAILAILAEPVATSSVAEEIREALSDMRLYGEDGDYVDASSVSVDKWILALEHAADRVESLEARDIEWQAACAAYAIKLAESRPSEPTPEDVERVAKAMITANEGSWSFRTNEEIEIYRRIARAAIAAFQSRPTEEKS